MKLLMKRILSHVPTKLPVGLPQFEAWADSIIELAGDYADHDSMRYAIASNLIHLPHNKASVPKAYFVNALRKAAANQVASFVFQDIKIKQAEAAKLAEEQAKLKQAEDTASNGVECPPNTTN